MSEWSIEHAWKLTPAARADAHQIPPTHSRSTTSSNDDVQACVPVNAGVHPGFRGVCDTVLTQNGFVFLGKHNDAYAAVPTGSFRGTKRTQLVKGRLLALTTLVPRSDPSR